MAIPDYESIMLPLLEFAEDQNPHTNSEAEEHLAKRFGLSEEERSKLQPSGYEPVFRNRMRWARFYLNKAVLVVSVQGGAFKITTRGADVLRQRPQKITSEFLRQFPEFVEFLSAKKNRESEGVTIKTDVPMSPEDKMVDTRRYDGTSGEVVIPPL